MNDQSSVTKADIFIETSVHAKNQWELLNQNQVDHFIGQINDVFYPIIRRYALTILNSDVMTDDSLELIAQYPNFSMVFKHHPEGLEIIFYSAPAKAFIDGILIKTIYDQLLAFLRDMIAYQEFSLSGGKDAATETTSLVFKILRNAKVLKSDGEPTCIVCWGGRSINESEYNYACEVGKELGLRCMDICTGSGPGAMKGPMQGALYGHHRQKYTEGRFIGITEPGIIAAEPPNAMITDLVIMPDIEKRLEAFVRIAHGIIIFPGGAGTIEEILYLLAILADPANADNPLPAVLTGPDSSRGIIEAYVEFFKVALGKSITEKLMVIINDPFAAACYIKNSRDTTQSHRSRINDGACFNWSLAISPALQKPFIPTHSAMRALKLNISEPPQLLIAELRRLFSGIVSGSVKPNTRSLISKNGPFEIQASSELAKALDRILRLLISEKRIKVDEKYEPCYTIITI